MIFTAAITKFSWVYLNRPQFNCLQFQDQHIIKTKIFLLLLLWACSRQAVLERAYQD